MEGLTELQEAIARMTAAAGGSSALSDDELGGALVEIHRCRAQLCEVEASLTAAFDLRKAYAGDGSRTAAAWLGRKCNTSPRAARRQTRRARRLRHMPATAAALADGDIDETHVEELGERAASPRKLVADAFPAAEEHLVELAKSLPFDDFVQALRHWEEVVDEDGAEDRAEHDLAARRLHISETFRGNFVIDGQLDVVGGTEVATALSRIEQELFEADLRDVRERLGDAATVADIERTLAQRRADALVEMARRAMAAPPGARLPEPLVTVVVGLETLQGRVCEMFNRTTVTPGTVARLLTDAFVERAVFDGPNRIIELGHRERFFRGGLRRVIEIRDRHCQHPGCRRPHDQCEGDHIQPWAMGGPTTQENGRLQCGFHNRWRNTQPLDEPLLVGAHPGGP